MDPQNALLHIQFVCLPACVHVLCIRSYNIEYYILNNQGLKAYKYDLMAVWKFVVPHRDPSLLPRQWRTALGTQKSYKLDEAKKEKRRLYDLKRRENKKADMSSWQSSYEKEVCYL